MVRNRSIPGWVQEEIARAAVEATSRAAAAPPPPPRPGQRATAAPRTVAEEIAAVVADVRGGRVARHLADNELTVQLMWRARQEQPVIDATGIYTAMVDKATRGGINLYDDFPSVISPWPEATIAYVNQHGNVLMLQAHCEEWNPKRRWDTDNPIDWDRVRWLVEASVWIGGRDRTGRPVQTNGPVRVLQHAVYEDGSAGDMRWVSLVKRSVDEPTVWEMPTAVFNATLNFLACKNVDIAVPTRPFPVRSRLRQTRVQVQTIVVRPPGSRRGGGSAAPRPVDALDTPLTSVRGRFNHYGPQYDKGLLFGKYAGKFWIPAHARGAGDGFEQKNYLLRPGDKPIAS